MLELHTTQLVFHQQLLVWVVSIRIDEALGESGPGLDGQFVGHQLAAASHVRLLKRAVHEVLGLARLPLDNGGRALSSLQRLCRRIQLLGLKAQ